MKKAFSCPLFFIIPLFLFHCSEIKKKSHSIQEEKISEQHFEELWDSLYLYVDSQPEEIIRYAAKIHELAEADNNKKWLAKSTKAFGYGYYGIGNFKSSTAYYLKSTKYFKELGDLHEVANIYNNIGLSYLDTKDYATALSFFTQAKEIDHYGGKSSDKALVFRNIALCYKKLKLYQEAEKNLKAGEKVAREAKDHDNLSWIYNTYGNIKTEQAKYDRAIAYFSLSLQQADSFQNSQYIKSMVYNNIGEAYFLAGEFTSAKEWLRKAVIAKKALGNSILCQSSYNLLARILIQEKKYQEAISLLEGSLQELNPEAVDRPISESLALINQALLKMNDEAKPTQYAYLNQMMGKYSQKLLAYNQRVSKLEEEMEAMSRQQAMKAAEDQYAFTEELQKKEAVNEKMRYAFLVPILLLIAALVSVYLSVRKNQHYKKLYQNIEQVLNKSRALRHLK